MVIVIIVSHRHCQLSVVRQTVGNWKLEKFAGVGRSTLKTRPYPMYSTDRLTQTTIKV